MASMLDSIDIIVLTRDDAPINDRVRNAILSQRDVRVDLHQIVGRCRESDANRWEPICRARNQARNVGASAWVMFVDDDVVISSRCASELISTLKTNPSLGAVASRYRVDETDRCSTANHVTMGATMFRRSLLNAFQFRWEMNKCECQCCCDDLRAMRLAIDYHPSALSTHEPQHNSPSISAFGDPPSSEKCRYILAAFDQQHFGRFYSRFLPSLRSSGNFEPVIAVGYGLLPRQQRMLANVANLDLVTRNDNGIEVPIRRLEDFQQVVGSLPKTATVAYWDSGDVMFQESLQPLWREIELNRSTLLVVKESYQHPENTAVFEWTHTIKNEEARNTAFDLMRNRPFLNSGFAAGTKDVVLDYLVEGHRLRHSEALDGTRDWGDQTALNLYCYLQPNRHTLVDEQWNYCLAGRDKATYYADSNGTIRSRSDASAIAVVHGNANTLEAYWFARNR